jgi:anti-sigma regulatory factor (Ser/Thr protein kinase)
VTIPAGHARRAVRPYAGPGTAEPGTTCHAGTDAHRSDTLGHMRADIEAAAPPARPTPPVRTFTQLLSATRRGARLARLLAEQQLADWGRPRDSEQARDASLITAELSANAIRHGRVRGRDFRLTLVLGSEGVLRIEVSDARVDRQPVLAADPEEGAGGGAVAETGRGLPIVAALADRWGVHLPDPPLRKTVWAELASPRE